MKQSVRMEMVALCLLAAVVVNVSATVAIDVDGSGDTAVVFDTGAADDDVSPGECEDQSTAEDCESRFNAGECTTESAYMYTNCAKTCQACHMQYRCVDESKDCAYWATVGECAKNPSYMKFNCALSCNTCHLQDHNIRCVQQMDNRVERVQPGDVDKMFNRAITFTQYDPSILSSPATTDGPWVIAYENFLTDAEVDFINAYPHDFKFSGEVGTLDKKTNKLSVVFNKNSRTSTTSWCQAECIDEPIIKQISEKITDIVQVPIENCEHMQFLQYEIGQEYKSHHDYIDINDERVYPPGPRMYTFFLYLNEVEEGGETVFNSLDIAVKPGRGKAILWPSVLNEDPSKKDPRTMHQAMPVVKGLKYAANFWVHLYDFRGPHTEGCTG